MKNPNLCELDNHERILMLNDRQSGLSAFVAIHRVKPGAPAFGATRLWKYPSRLDALKDALRLSKMMSYKSALAGLPYGGAKAVILENSAADKDKLLRAYAKKINQLEGNFITGADVGLSQDHVRLMKKVSPFMVGASVDPTKYTAEGMFYGLESSLKEAFGKEDISGRSFAIQGLGKIGFEFLGMIYPRAGKIFVSDVNPAKVKMAKEKFPNIQIVSPQDIHKQKADVYAPCALNGVLNAKTIPQLKCKIIAGGANNQLENEKAGELLYRAGILYAPDYVINAGGLISVVSEFEDPKVSDEMISKRLLGIKNTLQNIFSQSRRLGQPTNLMADLLAEKIIKKNFKS